MKQTSNKRMIYGIAFIAVLMVSIWHATLGIHSDELHSVALGDMIAGGNAMFKECWFYLQLSAVFNSPLIYLYKVIAGSTEGVVLFIRITTILIQALISYFFYITFRKDFKESYVMTASILFMIYVADFPSLMYKQELILFTLLLIIFMYRFYKTRKNCYLIWVGITVSCSVLAYPTSVLYLFLVYWLLYRVQKLQNADSDGGVKKVNREFLTVAGTCVLCAAVFMIYIGFTTGIENFISYFPVVFVDENLDTNFIRKLLHPVLKMIIMGVVTVLPMLIISRVEKRMKCKENILLLPVMLLLLTGSFGMQMFIERTGITWHVINYPYTVALFSVMGMLLILKNEKYSKDIRVVLDIFISTAVMTIFIFTLASNQGNVTCMYGMVLGAMLFLIVLPEFVSHQEDCILNHAKRIIAVALLLMGLFSGLILVYETESTNELDRGQRTVFTERTKADAGPLKGMKLGQDTNATYTDIYCVVNNQVSDQDALLVLGNHEGAVSLGHLSSEAGYATYSPQGGWKMGKDGKLKKFFLSNSHLLPTVILIDSHYIASVDDWFQCEDGKYIGDLGFHVIDEERNYFILRR